MNTPIPAGEALLRLLWLYVCANQYVWAVWLGLFLASKARPVLFPKLQYLLCAAQVLCRKIVEQALKTTGCLCLWLHHFQVVYLFAGWFAAIALHETLQSLHYSKPGHLSVDLMPGVELGMSGALQCAIALALQVFKCPPTPAWLIGEVVSDFILAKLQS
jgi:hypothetical protein